MKKFVLFFAILFSGIVINAQKVEMSNSDTLNFVGFSGEIIFIKLMPDSTAKIYLKYSVFCEYNYYSALFVYDKDQLIKKGWVIDEEKNTGVLSFTVKQAINDEYTFKIRIYTEGKVYAFHKSMIINSIYKIPDELPVIPN
jgi:hypothetical protein